MRVYVPLTVARAVMASVMKTHDFEGVTYGFAPGLWTSGSGTRQVMIRLLGMAGVRTGRCGPR